MRRLTSIVALTLVLGARAVPASAQTRPAAAVEFAAGALFFPDDGTTTEGFAGGAGRFYVSPRVSLGPEIAFVKGDDHSHLMVTGNVTVDLAAPEQRVMPFVVVGAGLFRTNESFPNNETFSHNEGAFTAGGGVRALLGSNVVAGVEARVGWELHVRVNGFVGVQFGR